MKFDVIIGNPPYQELDGGGSGSSATPVYNLYVDLARALNPKVATLICPSRWMEGGKGLDEFRASMLADTHISHLVTFADAKQIFPGVEIKGGISYFVWQREHDGPCLVETVAINGEREVSIRKLASDGLDVFVRSEMCLRIYEKVAVLKERSFKELVAARRPYGLCADVFKDTAKYELPKMSDKPVVDGCEVWGLSGNKRVKKYIPKDYPIPRGKEEIGKWKIFIPKAYGAGGAIGEQIPSPILGSPIQICTETFLRLGCFDTEAEAKNCLQYLRTKFFRLLVGIKKTTQNTSIDTYALAPIQDFGTTSDIDWTQTVQEIDKQLYQKYDLTQEQIDYIEKMIAAKI